MQTEEWHVRNQLTKPEQNQSLCSMILKLQCVCVCVCNVGDCFSEHFFLCGCAFWHVPAGFFSPDRRRNESFSQWHPIHDTSICESSINTAARIKGVAERCVLFLLWPQSPHCDQYEITKPVQVMLSHLALEFFFQVQSQPGSQLRFLAHTITNVAVFFVFIYLPAQVKTSQSQNHNNHL